MALREKLQLAAGHRLDVAAFGQERSPYTENSFPGDVRIMAIGTATLLFAAVATSSNLDLGCSGPDNWAAKSAYAQLKNAGLITPENVDFPKIHVALLAQQKIGKDLYRQIHEVTFPLKSGEFLRTVTTSNASSEECSMSGVKVRVVDKVFGDYP